MKYQFPVVKTMNPKVKPDESKLGFGNYFTDHMFVLDYSVSRGWHGGRIVPYGKLVLPPAARVFHYGQEMFEGMKAYGRENGVPVIFRADKHIERAQDANVRMCIPELDTEIITDAVNQLVEVDKDWIPSAEGTALYVRPFIIATEPKLSVGPSVSYIFAIILSPVGPYYEEGIAPASVYVETEYIRSVLGGPGYVKVGANCANTFLPVKNATTAGFNQVLWLDAKSRKYVEEIGNANAFFVIDGEVITPPLAGTVLPGITRDSAITLLRDFGYYIKEEQIAIDDIYRLHAEGRVQEVFSTGTSVTVSPVGKITWNDKEIVINNGEMGPVAKRLYDELSGIHTGRIEDTHGWIQPVK
ncbi:MAG: branched-chain amino acid aminotransferase [Firmicutes bacterium]|nr:branched-chain amino acid aminotransferase [Clostridiales bacterium]MBQ4340621.1 branched-chain amino acid aminotransferase [Bacillota bacterium]